MLTTSRYLSMPPIRPPYTCPDLACGHPSCEKWRQMATEPCARCDRMIRTGEAFVQFLDATGKFVKQEHVRCAES